MFRPTIDGRLEELLEERLDELGFDSKGDFVRYAVRRELERQS
jgi:hypothetical protein